MGNFDFWLFINQPMTFELLIVNDTGPANIYLIIIEHPNIFRQAIVSSKQNIEFRSRGLFIK